MLDHHLMHFGGYRDWALPYCKPHAVPTCIVQPSRSNFFLQSGVMPVAESGDAAGSEVSDGVQLGVVLELPKASSDLDPGVVLATERLDWPPLRSNFFQ